MLDKKKSKHKHIVFQVMNFIYGILSEPFKLSADEQMMLITLAHHKGKYGIYPSIKTLGKELKRNPSSIKRTLDRLDHKKLILIKENPGNSNNYFLLLPLELSTAPSVDATPSVEAIPSVDALTPRASTHETQGVHAPQSTNRSTKKKNLERTRATPALPLSDDFMPSRATIKSAEEMGMSEEEFNHELEKFMNHYIGEGCPKADWQRVFMNWLIKFMEYKENPKYQKNETRSTVRDYEPEPAYDRIGDKQVAARALGDIFKQLNLKRKVVSNGIGLHGEVEKGSGSNTQ